MNAMIPNRPQAETGKRDALILVLLICLLSCLTAQAQLRMSEPNWDRSQALQAARKVNTQATLKPLFQLARSGNNSVLLDSLHALQSNAELSAPVRDYLLFSFTLGLGDLEAGSVSPDVLDFLSQYRPGTLVPHEEYPSMGVTLFNTRAAAAGVRNSWDRQFAAHRARNLLPGLADRWLSSYLEASQWERRGFLDALDSASPDQLRVLGRSALAQLDGHPELTVIAANAGLQIEDFDLLYQSVMRGGGADLPGILKTASIELSPEQNVFLLDQTLREGSDTAAALAIAQLAPAHLERPEIREMLFRSLARRNLGAAAALVLGASSDPEIQQRLIKIAEQKTGLEQQRAMLAISTGRETGR